MNLLDNELDAIHARIKFVPNREPSSFYAVIILMITLLISSVGYVTIFSMYYLSICNKL